jgi:tripartite-type tricarboxylate transporter receptor subunit TctC
MTSIQRRKFLQAIGLGSVAAAAVWPGITLAQEKYPARPIKFINPFAPGGSADSIGRLFAKELGEILGATLYVENVGGAGGTIGSDRVAKAAADGYTLLLSNVASQAIAAGLYPKLAYDPLKDFSHIAMLGALPNVLVVGPAVKANSLAELIALAKAKPGSLTFGSAGNGSTPHLCGELLNRQANIDTQHVPFKGAGPALLALMGGQTSFQFENISTAIPQIKGGKLRPLAVTSSARMPGLPDVPTVEEQGLKDFVVASWYGLSAPAGTPDEITKPLAKAVTTALANPDLRKQLVAMGVEPSSIAPARYKAFVAEEIARWRQLIKSSNAGIS